MSRRAVTLLSTLGLLVSLVGCTTIVTPTPFPAGQLSAPPTETATPVPPSATPVPSDTATPVPPTPTPSATLTLVPPTLTPTHSPTPTPSGPRGPELLAPPDGLVASLFDLMWKWERSLTGDEWFELQIWPDLPNAEPEVFDWLKETTRRITAAHLAPGRYLWRVIVVRGRDEERGEELSPYSEERTFVMALPSTIAILSATPPAMAVCPRNAVLNGGFEEGFSTRGVAEVEVANGWHPWWQEGPFQSQGFNKRPEYQSENVSQFGGRCVYEGSFSQKWFSTDATHHAGLLQQIYVPANSLVTASAWAQAWSSEKDDPAVSEGGRYSVQVGIDPTGGTNWRSSRIVWSSKNWTLDQWVHLSVQAQAKGNIVTIYLRGDAEWRIKHNNVYFDGVCVTYVMLTPSPTIYWWPSATPTSEPTSAVTIPPPSTPTGVPTIPGATSTPSSVPTIPGATSTPTSVPTIPTSTATSVPTIPTMPAPTSTPTGGAYPGATNTPSSYP